jgi:excisionase family DNA binding protein
MSDDEWLSIKEVATELKVHASTIWQLIKDGHIEAARVGRQWRIKRSELERYLEGER